MKKFIVIGNPIKHSLSPTVHEYWFKKYNEKAKGVKKFLEEKDLKKIIFKSQYQTHHIFKKKIIPFLDELSLVAKETLSVNTIYKNKLEIIGDNTDGIGLVNSLLEHFSKKSIKSILLIGAVIDIIKYYLCFKKI